MLMNRTAVQIDLIDTSKNKCICRSTSTPNTAKLRSYIFLPQQASITKKAHRFPTPLLFFLVEKFAFEKYSS